MTNRWRLVALLIVSLVAAVPSRARADDPELRAKIDELKRELARQKLLLDGMLDLQEMRQHLAALEQRVAALEGRTTQARESRYFSPTTGTIRLENQLATPATFIVGGEPHRLAAGQILDLANVPAGPFFYEVLVDGFGAVQPRVTRTLKPGERFRIFTYPR
jgi:hypothetical protein